MQAYRATVDDLAKINIQNSTPGNLAPKHKRGEHFLRGPVPMVWLNLALRCGHKSGHLTIALWYLSGLNKGRNPVRLTAATCREFCITTKTARTLLIAFEQSGLVSVDFHRGRGPTVYLKRPTEGTDKEYKTYFISDNNGLCKIGRSEDVERRIKSLQTGNGNTLTLIYAVPGDQEKAFHRRFKAEKCPAGREWFYLRGSLLEYLNTRECDRGIEQEQPDHAGAYR